MKSSDSYAWQKVDEADYSGPIAESRKALELLRKLLRRDPS